MVFGSNDYINNYLMPSMYPSSFQYSPPDFANLLLNHYARQIVVRKTTWLIILTSLASIAKFIVIILKILMCRHFIV